MACWRLLSPTRLSTCNNLKKLIDQVVKPLSWRIDNPVEENAFSKSVASK